MYNGLGQRVSKTGSAVNSGGNEYVYDEAGQLIGEYDAAGNVLKETIWFAGAPAAVLKPLAQIGITVPSIYYVYADHLATPRVITDSAGAIVWSWVDADPFGMTQPSEAPAGGASFTFNMRFPGQYFDRETALHYNYFRDYDPQTGRYVQSDPIGLVGGINTYGYVGGNPLIFADPNGQQATMTWCLGGPWACAAGVAATGWAIWMSTPSGQKAARNAVTSASKTEQCNQDCNATASRGEAMSAAYAWAGISISGIGANPIPWSNLNMPSGISRGGPEYGEFMRNNYPPYYGYNTSSGASVVEHPFGHPDQPGPAHHNCPHFHAKNSSGIEKVFEYKSGA